MKPNQDHSTAMSGLVASDASSAFQAVVQRSRLKLAVPTWLARDAVVLLLFLIMTLLVLSPIVLEMRTRVIGWLGENVQYAYITGWTAQALLIGQSPFVDLHLNYPDGLALTTTDVPFVSNLVVAPATWLLGPIFGYNLIILLGFWLSGYFAYLWIHHVTGSRAGGVIAGLVFLLAPYRLAQSYGHLQMVCTYPLPLFFWALDHGLVQRPTTWGAALVLAGATLLVGGASQYYLVICLVTGAAYALFTALLRLSDLLRSGPRLLLGVGGGAVVSALPYLATAQQGMYTPYNLLDTRIWSLDPLDLFVPARLHPLWGDFFERLHPEQLWVEKTLYLGTIAMLLAIVALLWRHNSNRLRARVWLGVALVAAVFALGTDLHINGQPLQVDAPVWLPAYYLAHLPFLNLMRVWSRFAIVTVLFVALLAGVGAARLARWPGRRRWPALALCGVLLCVDLLPGTLESAPLAPRAVDLWLARQPGDFAVAVLPPPVANYQAMFGSLLHGKHLPAFNHPNHIPQAYRDFAERALRFPDADAVRQLRQMGLRYLLLERSSFDGKRRLAWSVVESQLAHSPDLVVVDELDGVVIVAFR